MFAFALIHSKPSPESEPWLPVEFIMFGHALGMQSTWYMAKEDPWRTFDYPVTGGGGHHRSADENNSAFGSLTLRILTSANKTTAYVTVSGD